MIGILIRNSFLIWNEDLVINVADFYLNKPGLYFDGFGIHRRPNVKSEKIIEYPKRVLEEDMVDYLW